MQYNRLQTKINERMEVCACHTLIIALLEVLIVVGEKSGKIRNC